MKSLQVRCGINIVPGGMEGAGHIQSRKEQMKGCLEINSTVGNDTIFAGFSSVT